MGNKGFVLLLLVRGTNTIMDGTELVRIVPECSSGLSAFGKVCFFGVIERISLDGIIN